MKLDLTKFKKIASDEHSTTLKHIDGHHLVVAHSKLKPVLKKQLEELPHFDEGGVMPAPENMQSSRDQSPAQQAPQDLIQPQQQQQMMSQAPWAKDVPPVPEMQKEAASSSGMTEKMKHYNDIIDMRYKNIVGADPEAMKFGPNGEEPIKPDYNAFEATNKDIAEQMQSEKNKMDWEALDREKQNKERESFGLKPLPGQSGLGSDRAKPIGDIMPQVPQQQAPMKSQEENPFVNMGEAYQQAFGMGMKGIEQQQQAESQMGKQKASAAQDYTSYLKQVSDLDSEFNRGQKNKMDEINNLLGEIKQEKINPKAYMENMSAPGRVAGAIGLILGGIGGGLTHQGSSALQFLQQQIDRDVDSQKNNINNKMNLVSHYSQALGDARAGEAFARATQHAIYAAKVDEAAANIADPMAKARALQLKSQLMQQAIPYMQKAQMYDMLYGTHGQQLPPEKKLLLMKNSGMIDDKQYAEGNKEAGKAHEIESMRNNLVKSFNDVHSKILNGAFSPNDVESAKAAFAGPLAKIAEGRFNMEESKNQIDALFPKKTDFSQQTVQNKMQRLHSFMDSLYSTPTLSGLGIAPKKMQSIQFKPGVH